MKVFRHRAPLGSSVRASLRVLSSTAATPSLAKTISTPTTPREHTKTAHTPLHGDLFPNPKFIFNEGDLQDEEGLLQIFQNERPDAVAHMAAMAAVRYSQKHPLIYGHVNVQAAMNLLDAVRQTGAPSPGGGVTTRCVLASTGSVYGTSTPVPFKEDAPADRPLAPYPASKRAMELMAHCFHHLWKLPTTIVRFFNVYTFPHGRPDMMPWQWTHDILAGKPLTIYNAGHLHRDWTYIDEIVAGLILALDNPPPRNRPRERRSPVRPSCSEELCGGGGGCFEIFNLGCSNPIENLHFIQILESLLGKKAILINTPTPATEPLITHADITKARQMLGYEPKVQLEEGLRKFVEWMRMESLI